MAAALSSTRDGKLASTFRRQQEVFLAYEHQPETLVATGKDAAIAANADGIFLAWTGSDGVLAKVPGHPDPVHLDPDGAFPQLVVLPRGQVLAAWEHKGEIESQLLTANH